VNCGCPINKQAGAAILSQALAAFVSDEDEPEERTAMPSFWKKPKALVIYVAVFLLIVAAITNPSERKHRKAVAAAVAANVLSQTIDFDDIIGAGFTDAILTILVERQNFIFFSLTRDRQSDDVIGIGAFGHVWLSVNERNNRAQKAMPTQQKPAESVQSSASAPIENAKSPAAFVPTGYKIIQEVNGDLNKDGLDDYVFVIAGKQDESRRGIVIAFNKGGDYENVLENRNIFSYDKEQYVWAGDPVHEVTITKGVLNIKTVFRHGNGAIFHSYSYKFRYQNADFELIGYDNSEYTPADGESTQSINLLSKKMQIKHVGYNGTNEVWTDIIIQNPIKLRKIVSLDEFESAFNVGDYIIVK